MRYLTLVSIVLLALAMPACDGPTAGEISIDLVTPNTSDGAILFKLRAPSSGEFGDVAAACSGCQVFSYRVTESEVYCVVTGSLTSGPLARVVVSNAGARGIYEMTILEVSGVDRRLRSDVGYALKLAH